MRYITDGEEMRAIDRYTIDTLGYPSILLMERAALAFVGRLQETLSGGERIVCVCGTGNNGGDGVAIARILFSKGYASGFYLAGSEEKASPETKKELEMARNTGVPEYNTLDLRHARVVVDGIFGTGLCREVEGRYKEIVETINAWRAASEKARVWSVDIPSGLHAGLGRPLGVCVKADATVTFGLEKRGMVFYPGRSLAGKVFVEDIGFPKKAVDACLPGAHTFDMSDMKRLPVRKPDSNKGDHGRLLVIAGSKGMAGAGYFAAKAASRMGTGLVRMLTPEENRIVYQIAVPEALITPWTAETLTEDQVRQAIDWADGVVIGPGMGAGESGGRLVEWTLRYCRGPLVMDADALNILARKPEWLDKLPEQTILTPHVGEMARLTGKSVRELKGDPAGYARDLAVSRRLICVMKDAATVVASVEGELYINTTGNQGMASGGSGDVLAGVIGALVCQGSKPYEAARLGVYVHGLAGDVAREKTGAAGMSARELLDGIACVMKRMDTEEG